jgi:ribosomal protein S12 methylthiotransferase accessory factor
LGVSCFQCELVDEQRDPLRALGCARGYGCHFDASVAFERALCEAAQSRLTAIAGTRDDVYARDLSRVRSPTAHAAAQIRRSRAMTEPWRGAARRALVDAERAQAELCERLVRRGFGPPLVVDLSKPGWPVHVVRVLVPGLLNTETHTSPEDARA